MIGCLNVSYEIYCNHILTLQPRQVNKQNSFLNTVRKLQDHHMAITWPSHDHHMAITWPSQDNHWQLYSCHTFHDLQDQEGSRHAILLDTHYNTHHNTSMWMQMQMSALNVRTNLLSQMHPLKLWKVLDVPQVIMVIATFLATNMQCRTGDSIILNLTPPKYTCGTCPHSRAVCSMTNANVCPPPPSPQCRTLLPPLFQLPRGPSNKGMLSGTVGPVEQAVKMQDWTSRLDPSVTHYWTWYWGEGEASGGRVLW